MMLQPLRDRVLVKPVLQSEMLAVQVKAQSGFLLAKPKYEGVPNTGRVVAVGPQVDRCSVGDLIVFCEVSPMGIHWEGEGYLWTINENVEAIWID